MENDIDFGNRRAHKIGIANVPGDDVNFGKGRHFLEPTPAVERIVEHHCAYGRAGSSERFDKMRSDEAVGTGHQDLSTALDHLTPSTPLESQGAANFFIVHGSCSAQIALFRSNPKAPMMPTPSSTWKGALSATSIISRA